MPRFSRRAQTVDNEHTKSLDENRAFQNAHRRRVRTQTLAKRKSLQEAVRDERSKLFQKKTENLDATKLAEFRKLALVLESEAESGKDVLDTVQKIRVEIATNENNYHELIASGVLPRLIAVVDLSREKLCYEIAWILTNIAAGKTETLSLLIELGAFEKLLAMLRQGGPNLRDQAIWALANVAGDVDSMRDFVLNNDIVALIHAHLADKLTTEQQSNVFWIFTNLTLTGELSPDYAKVKPIMPTCAATLQAGAAYFADECVLDSLQESCLVYALKAIGNVLANKAQQTLAFHDFMQLPGDFYKTLIEIVRVTHHCQILAAALKVLGTLALAEADIIDKLLEGGVIPALAEQLARREETNQVKNICWVLSNFAANSPTAVTRVLAANIHQALLEAYLYANLETKSEIALALYTFVKWVAVTDLPTLVNEDLIMFFGRLVENRFNKAKIVGLMGLRDSLRKGEEFRQGGQNPVAKLISDSEIAKKIEDAQEDELDTIYDLASEIIREYFGGIAEDDDDLILEHETCK